MSKAIIKQLEAEVKAAIEDGRKMSSELTTERAVISTLQKSLRIQQTAKIQDNTRFQKQIQDLLKEKETLKSALNKAKEMMAKVEDLINFFINSILKKDGTFPSLKWYNFGKVLQIIKFLIVFIPEIIAIFKKK